MPNEEFAEKSASFTIGTHKAQAEILEKWHRKKNYIIETNVRIERYEADMVATKDDKKRIIEIKREISFETVNQVLVYFVLILGSSKTTFEEFFLATTTVAYEKIPDIERVNITTKLEKTGIGLLLVNLEKRDVEIKIDSKIEPLEEIFDATLPQSIKDIVKELTPQKKEELKKELPKVINSTSSYLAKQKDDEWETKVEKIKHERTLQLLSELVLGGFVVGGIFLIIEGVNPYLKWWWIQIVIGAIMVAIASILWWAYFQRKLKEATSLTSS